MSPGSGSLLVKTATDLKETADGNEVDGKCPSYQSWPSILFCKWKKNEKMQKRLVYPKPVNSSLNIGAIGWLKHFCLKKRISFPEAFQLICFVLLKHPKCIRWTNLNRIEERIQSGCFFSALRTIRGCNLVQSSAHWNSVFDPPDQLRLGGLSL